MKIALMANFTHMLYYVKNIPQLIDFYERAFGVKPKFVHESGFYAELDTGATALAFAEESIGDDNLPEGYVPHDLRKPPAGCEIVFTVDNVQEAYEKAMDAGAVALVPPKEKPWGQTVAYVRDPAGILIEIASVMEA